MHVPVSALSAAHEDDELNSKGSKDTKSKDTKVKGGKEAKGKGGKDGKEIRAQVSLGARLHEFILRDEAMHRDTPRPTGDTLPLTSYPAHTRPTGDNLPRTDAPYQIRPTPSPPPPNTRAPMTP